MGERWPQNFNKTYLALEKGIFVSNACLSAWGFIPWIVVLVKETLMLRVVFNQTRKVKRGAYKLNETHSCNTKDTLDMPYLKHKNQSL